MQVFLLSSRPEKETAELARCLGADLFGGDFNREEKIRFLQGLRKRGVLATHIGNGQIDPGLAREAHVSVSLGGTAGLSSGTADIVVLGDSLDAFVDVADLAKGCHERIRLACRQSFLPNFLCVVGGYAGVLNGITAGLLANVGVNNTYRQAAQSLRDSQRKASFKRISV
jgi:cation transport ATPase